MGVMPFSYFFFLTFYFKGILAILEKFVPLSQPKEVYFGFRFNNLGIDLEF